MRVEINLRELKSNSEVKLEPELETLLAGFGLALSGDDKLLFWEQHFGEYGWAKYPNGKKKGGTMRFKEGVIRVPTYKQIPVYETNEFKNELNPRGLVYLDMLVVAHPGDFTEEELALDGFKSSKQLVKDMRNYYKTLSEDSVLSFYRFMDTIWDPNPDVLKSYFNSRK